jgi:single-strand DNA-binding protein
MQKIIVMGNIGRDAEFRVVNGRGVINFTLAVTEKYKTQNGDKVENTTWYSVSKWFNGTTVPAITAFLKKGQKMLIMGKPETKMYKTTDNQTAIDNRINADEITFAGGALNQNYVQGGGSVSNITEKLNDGEITEADDLPF